VQNESGCDRDAIHRLNYFRLSFRKDSKTGIPSDTCDSIFYERVSLRCSNLLKADFVAIKSYTEVEHEEPVPACGEQFRCGEYTCGNWARCQIYQGFLLYSAYMNELCDMRNFEYIEGDGWKWPLAYAIITNLSRVIAL
jgi:hypothetical protein